MFHISPRRAVVVIIIIVVVVVVFVVMVVLVVVTLDGGAKIPGDHILQGDAQILWDLNMELASSHPSGA
jgi:flagellar basal body-associated protein FliL